MDFRFGDDQLALRRAVSAFCRDRSGLEGVAGKESKPADQGMWPGLAELGVLGMLAGDDEELLPVEAAIVFEVLGAHLVTGPVIWSTISAPLVAGVEEGTIRVTGVAAGDASGGPILVGHVDESDVLLVLRGEGVERIPTDQLGDLNDRVRALASAKVLAGEAGIGNGRAAVQILGGMGFTWDMLPHYFLKRAWTLEQAFGCAPSHALALAAALGSEGSA